MSLLGSVDIIEKVVDEETFYHWNYKQIQQLDEIPVCKCLTDIPSEEQIASPRKRLVLSTVSRTQDYLRERRIPELIRYLLTQVISAGPPHPVIYLKGLIDDCMLFRAGHGPAPVLYEDRHLKAVVKSFDPGNRGWLTSGQVRRAFTTLGLTPEKNLPEKVGVEEVLIKLRETQECELLQLLSAGMEPSWLDEEPIQDCKNCPNM